MDPDTIRAAIEALKNQDADAALQILEDMLASAAGAAPKSESSEGAGDAADAPPEEQLAMNALATEAISLTGRTGAGEALVALRAVFAEREAAAQRAREEAAARDLSSRRELVGELVQLRAETPATAWEDADKRIPSKRLAAMPLDELRGHVAALRAAYGKQVSGGAVQPPARAEDSGLTPAEQAIMAKLPEDKREEYRQLRLRADRGINRRAS